MCSVTGHGPYSPLSARAVFARCDTDTESYSDEEVHRSGRGAGMDSASTAVLSPSLCSTPTVDVDLSVSVSPPMARKMAAALMCAVCVFSVAAFLWLVPCAPAEPAGPRSASGWESPYYDIELKGPLFAVDAGGSGSGSAKNLVGMFRGDAINPPRAEGGRSSEQGGLVCVAGGSGAVGWWVSESREPRELDCALLDVDGDGRAECLVSGARGLLAAVDALEGTVHWYLHRHSGPEEREPFPEVRFPLLIPDVDGDGVPDLLTPVSLTEGDECDSLAIVSGSGGSASGRVYRAEDCSSLDRLQMDERGTVVFACRNSTTRSESLKLLSLDRLRSRISNRSSPIRGDPGGRRRRRTATGKSIFAVPGGKLSIENRGTCPEDCRTSVELTDGRLPNGGVFWKYSADGVRAMAPAILNFSNDPTEAKGRLSGFVLKFWQWNGADVHPEESDGDSPIEMENVSRSKRRSPNGLTVERLTERIVLVAFNATDVRVMNASQSDIVRICRPNFGCQPDPDSQENSLSVVDLDGDGSRELVAYLSTFVCSDGEVVEEYSVDASACERWRLRSMIRVVRLEMELPKLYGTASGH